MEPWQIVALLGLVIFVFSFLLKKRASPDGKRPDLQQFEEAMEHFAQEMEEDNKELLQHIANMKKEHELHIGRLTDKIDFLEKQMYDLTQDTSKTVKQLEQRLAEQGRRQEQRDALAMPGAMKPTPPAQPAPPPARAAQTDERGIPAAAMDQVQAMKTIRERYQEVFLYHQQGKSVEFIAKKCGMNKGEIQLILKLARQEEEARVE